MANRNFTRTISFTEDTVRLIDELANQEGRIFEPYLAEKIERVLIPTLQATGLQNKLDMMEDEEWNLLTRGSLTSHATEFEYDVTSSYPTLERAHLPPQTTNLFPLLLATRVLLRLHQETSRPYISYGEYLHRVYKVSKRLKSRLIGDPKFEGDLGLYERGFTDGLPWTPIEDQMGHRPSSTRSTKSPFAVKLTNGRQKFETNYVGIRPHAKQPGSLIGLGLVEPSEWDSQKCIRLTKDGFTLATTADNPILDGLPQGMPVESIENPLHPDEFDLFETIIKKRMRFEWNRMEFIQQTIQDVLDLKSSVDEEQYVLRKDLEDAVKHQEQSWWSRYGTWNSVNMDLSGVLSRMRALGVVYDPTKRIQGARLRRYGLKRVLH